MDQHDVEATILKMLAEVLERDTGQLRQELENGGPQMPIDSLDAVDIIVQLEEHYGIELDNRQAGAAMRSVRGLAHHIVDVRARQERSRSE